MVRPSPTGAIVRKAGRCQRARRGAVELLHVDQFDTLGLGRNVPIATGNMSNALEALVDDKFVTLRVPYPMGSHAKGMDRIIDLCEGTAAQ